MAITGLKRSLLSNTSCFSNLYLFECLRKYKFKSCLDSLMMTIGKDISLAKKKLDCLRMKMCKGVRLRRVKVKGLARIRQLRESTIPTDLSSKHEVCFMMKSTFKVMGTCLWYLDSGCSWHMTGKKLISGVRTLDNRYGWFLMLILCVIAFVCQMKIYGINRWDTLVTNIFLLYLSMSQF